MAKVVGIGAVHSGEYQGFKFSNVPFFLEYEGENIEGVGCFKVNVPEKIDTSDIQIGDDVEVIYNRFGKVAGLRLIDE